MPTRNPTPEEPTYPVRAAARLTGLSPELLRAWERRHAAVTPLRTAGGTRRYRESDLERLRWLKAAVAAGSRIGDVAHLPLEALQAEGALAAEPPAEPPLARLEPLLAAFDRLDAAEAQRLLQRELAALGPVRFAREVALPLVVEIGTRWSRAEMGVAPEHLATGLLRSLLGAALQPTAVSLTGPRIVFGTPTGEPHELGLYLAAVTALGAGANPLFLGADLPREDLCDAVRRFDAAALALSVVTLSPDVAGAEVGALRAAIDPAVLVWLGGAGAAALPPIAGVDVLASLEALEQRLLALRYAPAGGREGASGIPGSGTE